MPNIKRIGRFIERRPHLVAAALIAIYLLAFQTRFVFSGDAWAEAYPEYLLTALATGWQGFFHLGWAGYFNFIPRLLVNLYLWLHGPVGYIDYFFRISVVAYAFGCCVFMAHPFNRPVIKNDYLRIFVSVMTMLTLYHVSSFSFINVWYMGFIVVALVSLHDQGFKSELAATGYAALGMGIALTKPSLVLLPLVVYRAVRLKEYLLGFVLSFAILLETLLVLSSSYLAQSTKVVVSRRHELETLALGPGLMALKTFKIFPHGLWMVMTALLVLAVAAAVLVWSRRIWRTIAVLAAFGLAVYTYFAAPDAVTIPDVVHNYQGLFEDVYRLQRELTIYFFIILILTMALDFTLTRFRSRLRRHRWAPAAIGVTLALIAIHAYRPIDMQHTATTADFTQFRSDLTHHVSVCMPVAPGPSNPDAQGNVGRQPGWYLSYYGGCIQPNVTKTFSDKMLRQPVGSGWAILVPGPLIALSNLYMCRCQTPTPGRRSGSC